MSLSYSCKSRHWYTIDRSADGRTATIKGEGVANYDFTFAINWSIDKKVSFGLLKGIAVDLEPNVNLELDKSTARQKFYISGSIPWPQDLDKPKVPIAISWTPPGEREAKKPKLKFNVIATVGASMPAGTVSGRSRTSGATASASAGIRFSGGGTVLKSFEIDPMAPFGAETATLNLRTATRYASWVRSMKTVAFSSSSVCLNVVAIVPQLPLTLSDV